MKITAIVPAYNEARNISGVLFPLQEAKQNGIVDDILVVCDGCNDNTAEIAKGYGAQVLELNPNRGKGGAMLAGVKATDAEIVVFIDADLIGLTTKHITDLITPVKNGVAEMTMGIFGGGRKRTDAAQHLAPFLTGQRAIAREHFLEIPDVDNARYGVEIAISKYANKKKWRIQKVTWLNMSQVMKEEKMGLAQGLKVRMRMYWEIIKASI